MATSAADRVAKTATGTTKKATDTAGKATKALPANPLSASAQKLLAALGQRAVSSVTDRVSGATERLTDYAEGRGKAAMAAAGTGLKKRSEGNSMMSSAVSAAMSGAKEKVKSTFSDGMGAVKGALGLGGDKGKKGKKPKITNIVEHIDVGVPIDVAYNQWTQFQDFPSFTKKVQNVAQIADEKVSWTAKVLWSTRTWESTIIDQVPEDHIIWRSEGEKGYVDGVVTFHELAPNLTRVMVVLEYHPQGLFEKTGNIWRAQGRRARLELKFFQRHVMTNVLLDPEQVPGWRGEIHDGEVTSEAPNGQVDRPEDNAEEEQPKKKRATRSASVSGSNGTRERRPPGKKPARSAKRGGSE